MVQKNKINIIKQTLINLAWEARLSATNGLDDDAKLLEKFCKEFIHIVWRMDFGLPSVVKCNQAMFDFISADKINLFQVTIRNDFKKKCEDTIQGFNLYENNSNSKLYIIFFRELTQAEKVSKSNFEVNSKVKIYCLSELFSLAFECDSKQTDQLYELCQNESSEGKRYVPVVMEEKVLCEFYIQRTTRRINKNSDERLELLEQFLNFKKVVLLGDAATGKTQQMKSLYNEFIDLNEGKALFYELKFYSGQTIIDFLTKDIALDSTLILMFDAFDEIEPKYVNDFINAINVFVSSYLGVKIIISARSNFYHTAMSREDFRGFETLLLNELNEKEITVYFELNLQSNWEECYEKVNKTYLAHTLSNAFYLSNIVKAYKNNKCLNKKTELMDYLLEISLNDYAKKTKVVDYEIAKLELSQLAFDLLSHGRMSIEERKEDKAELQLEKFAWIKCEDSKMEFLHNNYKEYLCAVFLASKNIDQIKEMIALRIEEKYYIRPQFVNTISFLFELKFKDKQFIQFILDCGKDVLINIESDLLMAKDRKLLLISVIEEYADKKCWFDSAWYSSEKLANLCINNVTAVSYLIERLNLNYHRTTLIGIINILHDVRSLYGYEKDIECKLTSWLKDERVKSDFYLTSSVLSILGHTVDLDAAKELYRVYSLHDDSSVRAAANAVLYERKLGEYFVEQLFADKKRAKLKARLMKEGELTDARENWYLSLAIKDIQNQDAIVRLGEILLENELNELEVLLEDYYESINRVEVPSETLKAFIVKLYVAMEEKTAYSERSKTLRSIVAKFDLNLNVAQALIKSNMPPWREIDSIAKIYNESIESLIMQLLLEKDYGKYCDRFITNLSYAYDAWQDVRLKLEQNNIFYTIPKNYEEEKKRKKQEEFDVLFDRSAVIKAILNVFEITEKDELNMSDVCKTDYGIIENLYQFSKTFFWKFHDERVSKQKFENYVTEDWIIKQIYEILSGKQSVKVSELQRKHLQTWCDSVIGLVDFKASIHYDAEGGYSTSCTAIIVAFLIRKFDLSCDQQIYADMICFSWGENSETFDMLEFLNQKLGKPVFSEKITDCICENLMDGYILENRLKYCIDQSINTLEEYIVVRLREFGAISELLYTVFIDYMIRFDAVDNLMAFYDTYNLTFKIAILRKLQNIQLIEEHTHIIENDIEKDNEDSIAFALQLLNSGNIIALRYYFEWVVKNNKFYQNCFVYRTTSISGEYVVESVNILVNLLELSYKLKTKSEEVKNDIHKALTEIAMSSIKNLEMVLGKLRPIVLNSSEEEVHYQNYYMDRMVHEYLRSSIAID